MRTSNLKTLRLPSGRFLLQNTPFELGGDEGGDGGIGAGINTAISVGEKAGVKKDSKGMQAAKSAAAGAAIGASVGSVIPGIGTVIGAGVGAVTGFIAGISTGPGGKEHRLRRARKAVKDDITRLALFKKPLNDTWYKGNLIYVLGVPGTQKEHEMTFHRYINGEDTVISKADAIKFIGLTNKGRSWANHSDKVIIASNLYGEEFLAQLPPKTIPQAKTKTKTSPKAKPKGLPSDIAKSIKGTVDKIKEVSKAPPGTVNVNVKVEKLASLVDDLKSSIKKDAKKLATSTEVNENLVNKIALSLSKVDKANKLLALTGLPKSYFV